MKLNYYLYCVWGGAVFCAPMDIILANDHITLNDLLVNDFRDKKRIFKSKYVLNLVTENYLELPTGSIELIFDQSGKYLEIPKIGSVEIFLSIPRALYIRLISRSI